MHELDTRVGPTLRRHLGYFNPRECALECKINCWTFYSLVEKGLVKPPMHRFGKRFYYLAKDIEKVKKQLKEN